MSNLLCGLNLCEEFILKKYEGEELFEVLILDKNGIKETITDKEKLNAFK